MGNQKAQPYISFGEVLKSYREKANKTQVEVSGAVEIDQHLLARYERGEIRPSEDILLLLAQHFGLKDEQARELWRLAGYFQNGDQFQSYDNDSVKDQLTGMNTSTEQPIVYTDMIQVMVNNYGMIIQFMQGASMSTKPLAVARVGMSREHAKSVVEVLKKTLDQADTTKVTPKKPLQLPSSNEKQE